MKKAFYLLGLLWLMMACSSRDTTTVTVVTDQTDTQSDLILISKDSLYREKFDTLGTVRYVLPNSFKDSYATINYKNYTLPIFIEAGKDLEVNVALKEKYKKATFNGASAKINEYLNGDSLKSIRIFFELDEQAFITDLFNTEKNLVKQLESMNFKESFVRQEKKRLHYMLFTYLGIYPSYHARHVKENGYEPSEKLYNTLKEVIIEDDEISNLSEYRWAWNYAIEVFGNKGLKVFNPELNTSNQLDFILQHIKNPTTIEKNVHVVVINYINNYGLDKADKFIKIYKERVHSPSRVTLFEKVCSKWNRLKSGQHAPDFKLTDINGKEVTLSTLAGKYVYIDVWATWCNPCRKELPHMQKLEKMFKGKNIHFVSVSCDKDKKAWENMVKEKHMEGIQLHMDKGSSFGEDYVIQGIPRFILLDKEGRIIYSEMTRPSDPATIETIRALKGI